MKRVLPMVLMAAAGFWIAAQTAAPQAELASHFPPGPVIYVEARDFAGLIRDWNTSAEKGLWLKSDNYYAFSRTRLFLRLKEAQEEYAAAAGFAADMPMVTSIAGTESALAIYDIGKLEFLYITRLPQARAQQSMLFRNRTGYQTRQSAGRTYYVKTDRGSSRTAAFAEADGYLILATREDLAGAALNRIAARQGPALPEEAWFDRPVKAASQRGTLRMVMNFPGLLRSPHFRAYWVQRNTAEFRDYLGGVSDLQREAGQIREDRVLVRMQTAESLPNEPNLAQVLSLAPPDAGLTRAWANPSADFALEFVLQKLVNPGPTTTRPSTTAPAAAGIPEAGSEYDLETRIDATNAQLPSLSPALEPIQRLLQAASLEAMLTVQSSRNYADGVFVGNTPAVVLRAAADWNQAAVRAAFPQHVLIRVQGRILVLAAEQAAIDAIAARFNQPAAAQGASYAAIYQHSRELAPFGRMMSLIDHNPEAQPPAEGEEREPPFFSGNVASLGRVLQRIETASVRVRNTPTERTESVTYKLRP